MLKLEDRIARVQALHDEEPSVETANLITRLYTKLGQLKQGNRAYAVDDARLNELATAMTDETFWLGMPKADRNKIYRELGVRAWRVGRTIERVDLG